MLKILSVPNKILTQKTGPVASIDSKAKDLVREMEKTLIAQTDPVGVGLAAPQVGRHLRIFIIKERSNSKTKTFINPAILKTERPKGKKSKSNSAQKLEGCLSIPGVWGPVKRASKILLRYQNLKGAWVEKWFSGFQSIIIQHECDHLEGILFTQRALEQKAPLYEEIEGELKKINY